MRLLAVSRLHKWARAAFIQETDLRPRSRRPTNPARRSQRVLTARRTAKRPLSWQDTARLGGVPADASATAPSKRFSDKGRSCSTAPFCPERSGTPTWVWLCTDVTDDALNDPAAAPRQAGSLPCFTVGDVNGDGVINAQDALAIRTACAGETTPAANVLLAMDADPQRLRGRAGCARGGRQLCGRYGAARSAGGRNMKSFRTKRILPLRSKRPAFVAAIVVI